MTQLSPLRQGRVTGSRAAAVLGISPYQTADEVLREMVRDAHGEPAEFQGNRATEWGNEHEIFGVSAWEDAHDEPLSFTGYGQRFRVHPLHDFLGVTPDGLTRDGNVVEVKCPLWGGYSVWQDVPWYEVQLRLAIECVGAEWGDLTVWRPGGAVHSRIERDPWWLEQHLPTFTAFLETYESTVADPALYGPMLEPLTDVRTDGDWTEAAMRFREAVATEKAAGLVTSDARARLLELTDKSAKGAGVSVSRSERRGSIDYKKALAELLPAAELEPWQKPGQTVWTVRAS